MNRKAMVLGLIALAVGSLLAIRLLAEADWNPTVMVRIGEESTELIEYAEALVGEVIPAPHLGHDGKFFFVQSMDPFYMEPDVHAVFLDRPAYRAQRMAYPTLAAIGGLLGPMSTTWGLIVVNILAMAIGSYYTAQVAMKYGLSHWFGLAFLINPGILVDQNINGGGIVAMAGLMAGVYYALSNRFGAAAVALTIAVLARETMVLAVIGIAAFVLYNEKRKEWRLLWPAAAMMAWWVFLRFRLDDGLSQDTAALSAPFVGLYQAIQLWMKGSGHELDMLGAAIVIFVSLSLLWKSWKTPTLLGWSVTGFAVLTFMMSAPVWYRYFDQARAVAPVLTAYLILLPALNEAAVRSTTVAPNSG